MIKSLIYCLVLIVTLSESSKAVEFYTEDFPPYNYMENGELTGIGPEIVYALAKELGEDPKISVLPWARAYKYVQERPDTAIFSIVRTPKREPEFQWVGPLYAVKVGLYTKRENKHLYSGGHEANLEQARKVGSVAVQLGGAGEELLTTLNFENLNPILNVNKSLFLLIKGRYDLLETSDVFMAYMAKEEGISMDAVSEAAVIGQYDMYLAFSKNTPVETVDKWRNALERYKQKRKENNPS